MRRRATSAASPGAALQKHADAIGAVIVGFPATIDMGDGTQAWSEEPAVDHAHVQARLRRLDKSIKLDLQRVALFGFSQGAQVAADLATNYPGAYLGGIRPPVRRRSSRRGSG